MKQTDTSHARARAAFLRELMECGEITAAAKAVGCNRHQVHRWCKADPGFAELVRNLRFIGKLTRPASPARTGANAGPQNAEKQGPEGIRPAD